jgi:hypothetical protein
VLRPQDIGALLKLALWAEERWTYAKLADELFLSASEAHSAVTRLRQARLLHDGRPLHAATMEFLVHGVRYAFAAQLGPMTRGIPTAHAAPPLREALVVEGPPPVWPSPKGRVRGQGVLPLYKKAPHAAMADDDFYGALALVDALRIGGARERKLAAGVLEDWLFG